MHWDLSTVRGSGRDARVEVVERRAVAGREGKALELLKKVSSIDPKDSRVLTNIALCYYLLGEYEKAEKNNDISLSYTPNFQWGLHLQSIIKSKKGDFKKII